MLVGVELIIAAVNPEIPVLRANFWWRLPSKTRPSLVERVLAAIFGLFLVVLGVYAFTLH